MRLKDRNRLIEILSTVQEMFEHVRTMKEFDQALVYIRECKGTIEYLQNHIKEKSEDFNDNELIKLIEICNCLMNNDEEPKKTLKKAIRITETAKQSIRKRINVRWTAIFLPYKASMWTAMESIWKAADEDPDCDAVVAPIPYYELDAACRPKKLCYEGDKFPSYVPITHFNDLHLEQVHPEMIFIHNPYDDWNKVTQVPECFFSSNLNQHTDCLVFSPYFTYGSNRKLNPQSIFIQPGIVNANKVIVQSEKVKREYVEIYGFEESKLLATGSPKIDAIVDRLKQPVNMPPEWADKLKGKKVFLLNTHMMYFKISADYAKNGGEVGDYAIRYHKEIFDALLNKDEYGLIWRPHPLMKTLFDSTDPIIAKRYQTTLEFIHGLEEAIAKSSNCVLDESSDYLVSMCCSDALITTYSSLIQEYMVTGKPVLIFQTKQNELWAERAFVKYTDNYFRFPPDNVTFEKFAKMVLEGEDPMKEKRLTTIQESFANLDGKAGYNAYHDICLEVHH